MSSCTAMKNFTRKILVALFVLLVCSLWFLTKRTLTTGIGQSWHQKEDIISQRLPSRTMPDLVPATKDQPEVMTDWQDTATDDANFGSEEVSEPDANGGSGSRDRQKLDGLDLDAMLEGRMPSFTLEEVQKRTKAGQLRLDDVKQDKWIIVTSIAAPTADVKYLSGLKGWKVLVVADSKTPTDWSYPNCIYLSVEKQKQLGFELVPMIPYGIYGRKNIGYLYALAHGAQIIYETDDDNRPTDKLQSFVYTDTMPGLMFGGQKVFNPYRHFGQSTLWPRGFPLSQVGGNNSNDYRLANSWKTPVIQQGAVNGDPDMDAIFRLTRKFTNSKLDVIFDPAGPPAILAEGVFTPYNAQNTLFLKNSFWSFYLPVSPTFRVTDIWRGYWTQRLLWEIDEYMGYFPPNAYQQRNVHNYLKDFEDEDQLYSDTEEILDFLYQWRCPVTESFFQCAYRLYIDMAKNKFVEQIDVEGMHKWLNDLVRLGYPEPERKALRRLKETSSGGRLDDGLNPLEQLRAQTLKKGIYTHFVPAEQIPPTINRQGLAKPTPALDQLEKTFGVCRKIESLTVPTLGQTVKLKEHFKDILLVVIFNNPYYQNINILEAIYRSIFPNIAYCGSRADLFLNALKKAALSDKVTFLEMEHFSKGFFGYRCAARAMSMSLNVTGYFIVGDDDIINIWNFFPYNKNHIWTYEKLFHFKVNATDVNWNWWSRDVGKNALLPAYEELRHWSRDPPPPEVISPEKFAATLASNIGPYPWTCRAVSDVYYIPARLRESARFYFDFFDEHKVFLELAVPTVLRGLDDHKSFEVIKGVNLYNEDRKDPWSKYDSQIGFVHPIKLSNPTNVKRMCKVYFPLVHNYGNSVKNMTIRFDNTK